MRKTMLPAVAVMVSLPPSMVMVPPLLSRMVMLAAMMEISLLPLPVSVLLSTAMAPALAAFTPLAPPAAERKLTSRLRSPFMPMPPGALMSSERAVTLALLLSLRASSMLPPAFSTTLLPPALTVPRPMLPSAEISMSLPLPPEVACIRPSSWPLAWRA
ncbi:hypothetical protein D9M71_250900 [compost metagenome]